MSQALDLPPKPEAECFEPYVRLPQLTAEQAKDFDPPSLLLTFSIVVHEMRRHIRSDKPLAKVSFYMKIATICEQYGLSPPLVVRHLSALSGPLGLLTKHESAPKDRRSNQYMLTDKGIELATTTHFYPIPTALFAVRRVGRISPNKRKHAQDKHSSRQQRLSFVELLTYAYALRYSGLTKKPSPAKLKSLPEHDRGKYIREVERRRVGYCRSSIAEIAAEVSMLRGTQSATRAREISRALDRLVSCGLISREYLAGDIAHKAAKAIVPLPPKAVATGESRANVNDSHLPQSRANVWESRANVNDLGANVNDPLGQMLIPIKSPDLEALKVNQDAAAVGGAGVGVLKEEANASQRLQCLQDQDEESNRQHAPEQEKQETMTTANKLCKGELETIAAAKGRGFTHLTEVTIDRSDYKILLLVLEVLIHRRLFGFGDPLLCNEIRSLLGNQASRKENCAGWFRVELRKYEGSMSKDGKLVDGPMTKAFFNSPLRSDVDRNFDEFCLLVWKHLADRYEYTQAVCNRCRKFHRNRKRRDDNAWEVNDAFYRNVYNDTSRAVCDKCYQASLYEYMAHNQREEQEKQALQAVSAETAESAA